MAAIVGMVLQPFVADVFEHLDVPPAVVSSWLFAAPTGFLFGINSSCRRGADGKDARNYVVVHLYAGPKKLGTPKRLLGMKME